MRKRLMASVFVAGLALCGCGTANAPATKPAAPAQLAIVPSATAAPTIAPSKTPPPTPVASFTPGPTATPAPPPTATRPANTATPKPSTLPTLAATAIPTRPPATFTPKPAPTIAPAPTAIPAPAAPVFTQETGSRRRVDPAWWPCAEGQVKGNRNSGIYHAPGMRDYAYTFSNVACFKSEAEAVNAGFRRAQR